MATTEKAFVVTDAVVVVVVHPLCVCSLVSFLLPSFLSYLSLSVSYYYISLLYLFERFQFNLPRPEKGLTKEAATAAGTEAGREARVVRSTAAARRATGLPAAGAAAAA